MANSEGPVFLAGEKTVATAGTAEPLVPTSQRVKSLVVIAKKANLTPVYLGGADVASTTNDGLDAAESITIEAVGWLDLADIFLDVDTNGEGIDFYAVKA